MERNEKRIIDRFVERHINKFIERFSDPYIDWFGDVRGTRRSHRQHPFHAQWHAHLRLLAGD